MRKLTKFFIAVVMLGAYACTTDTTKDLGANLGQGATEITISIEGSRTQLGADPVNGLYPLNWSEGDQISVNGLPSNELSADAAGSNKAVFSVQGLTAETYHIAYPAAGENQVVFAENQVHTNNTTFGSGVSTMFGKCNAGEPVTLQHLTGVLKIGVTGSATLTHAQISTVDRAPIAGAFAFDFEKEEVSATTDSKVVINYSFGEGALLTSKPTYLHVAVPAGEYDELYVTLYDTEGGVLVGTVKADSNKPLVAGNIRTFKTDIAYEAKNDVKYFVIRDVATLKQFATKAAEGLAMDAVLVADIDLAGEAWTSIEGGGFSGTVLGNGYSIKGLTAPLFNTTSASFKGLHLEDVAINETANPNVGAFARAIVATDTVEPKFTNCSANGTITVNCTEYTLAEGATETMAPFAIGGLVGRVEGVDISNCSNAIAIDVDQVVEISNATNIYESVAGIVGVVDGFKKTDESVVVSNLSNLENTGNIDVHTPKCTAASVTDNYRNTIVAYVAGVAGRFKSDNKTCTVSNITNRGNVTITGWYGQGLATSDEQVNYEDIDSCLAGAIGHIEATTGEHIYNYGKVSFPEGYGRFHYVGGVVGISGGGAQLSNLHNYGIVELPNAKVDEVTVRATVASLHCAGVLAHSVAGGSLTSSTNNNKVSIKCGTVGGGKHRYFRVAGIVAFADGSVSDCTNDENGQISCDVSIGKSGEWRDVCIGGVVAYKESDGVANSTNNAHIYAKLNSVAGAEIAEGAEPARNPQRVSIGGVVALSAHPCNNVTNNGTVETWGTHKLLVLGGVVGDMNHNDTHTVGGYYNNGKVYVRGGATVELTSYIGGCVGYAKGQIVKAVNSDKASVVIGASDSNTTFNDANFIGGCVGYSYSAASHITESENRGTITVYSVSPTNVSTAKSTIGGIAGRVNNVGATIVGTEAKPIKNTGAITIGANGGKRYIAGICPEMIGPGSYLTNEGAITYTGKEATNTYVSGIAGYVHGNCDHLLNSGDITINGSITALSLISGIFSNADFDSITISNAVNEGDIIVNGTFSGDTRFSGLQSDTNKIQTWTNCYNTGDITIQEGSSFSGALRIAGLLAYTRTANKTNTLNKCYNTGHITVEKGVSITNTAYIGGLIGQVLDYAPVVEGYLYNTGNVKVLHDATNKDLYVGGAVGTIGLAISNMQSLCEVVAMPKVGGVGMITGTSRPTSSAWASSCKLGGKIAKELDENGEPVWKTISAEIVDGEYDPDLDSTPRNPDYIPYWEAIYGNIQNNTDNCEYISAVVTE